MTILLDHCTPRRYKSLLESWGYSAELMNAHIPSDSPDEKVIELATRLDAVLLTVDLDFSNILDYPPVNYQGIIVVRYQANEESPLDKTLLAVLKDLYREDLRKTLVIVTSDSYRLRR